MPVCRRLTRRFSLASSLARALLSRPAMRALLRDGVLFVGCVVLPCTLGWSLEDPSGWRFPHFVGAALFVVATLMVFTGLRLLLTDPVGPFFEEPAFAFAGSPDGLIPSPVPMTPALPPAFETSSEIIHVEHGAGTARVVALLFVGGGPNDVHLLELDVTGEDLRPEVLAQAVAGVATGEPPQPAAEVDRVGFASGWGLTLPCPKLTH